MRDPRSLAVTCLMVLLAGSCRAGELQAPPRTPATSQATLATPTSSNPNPNMTTPALFLDAAGGAGGSTGPVVTRARWVKINGSLLLNRRGEPRKLPENAEITINLFPDTTYVGVIERVEEEGGSISWTGHLKDVETSELFIVYAADVFIGHFASPLGVYEVSNTGGDLYEVIQIDQSKLPGGEGDTKTPTTGP